MSVDQLLFVNLHKFSTKKGGLYGVTACAPGSVQAQNKASHYIAKENFNPDSPIVGSIKASGKFIAKPCIRVRVSSHSDRPLVPQLAKYGVTWNSICFCARHGDLRHVEWLLYLLLHKGQTRSDSDVNSWLDLHECKITFKSEAGKWNKPSFSAGFQSDLWFESDPICPNKTRWQVFQEYMDPQEETANVWRSYESLRPLISKQLPTKDEQKLIGPKTFALFFAFVVRYETCDVHLYMHLYFAHASEMMRLFGSIGLYRNEAEECVNSEHKAHMDRHSSKGGWGTSMTRDVLLFSMRKIYTNVVLELRKAVETSKAAITDMSRSAWYKMNNV